MKHFERLVILIALTVMEIVAGSAAAQQSTAEPTIVAPIRLLEPIDDRGTVTLTGNVRTDLTPELDLGPVEDSMRLHLYLVLRRTEAQQGDLDNLIARQQEPTAPEYHQWLTPTQFGARFGANPEDIATLSGWLESQGFQVAGVANNASIIEFAATAGGIRQSFHTELHYFKIAGGKYAANVADPQIPAALAGVVAGIAGMVKIPAHAAHTTPRPVAYDESTHRWKTASTAVQDPTPSPGSPAYDSPGGGYDVTPQDLYTIYNINPILRGGNLAAKATVAVIEQTDMEYGTVNAKTGAATGGDVVTFRSEFGVAGTLSLFVYHGYGKVACEDPGKTDANSVTEASLDAEWINATAPAAKEIYMSCDEKTHLGIYSSMEALVDNNLADVMSMSYSNSELNFTTGSGSAYTFLGTIEAQAATQGQTIFVCAGDSGADDKDQDTTGTATSGINVSGLSSPLVTVAGGTDFSDRYDALEGGPKESTYWSSTNTKYEGSALSYVPETAWNANCSSSLSEMLTGYPSVSLCQAAGTLNDGKVAGGGGGISTYFEVPSWQAGISGYTNTHRSSPDLSGFASSGKWGHSLLYCDSYSVSGCFTSAGGTSFVAPYLAGVTGLLVSYTGSRQGLLNPALYALAKAQQSKSATAHACYANGQTANAGVTKGLPAASCIFNDVTTSNNDVPCAAGSTNCYVASGDSYGMLSLTGTKSLTVSYESKPGFDQVTGLGTVNVANLINGWNTAFTSKTTLSASSTSILSSQSTTLTATVAGGAPAGHVDAPPALTGTVTFKSGSKTLGNCKLSGNSCKLTVAGTALAIGSNSIGAFFGGSGTYPSSTSSLVTVTVKSGNAAATD